MTSGVGSGRFRDTWAIRRWLDEQGLNMSDVARNIGVAPQVVSMTVRGTRNNRAVLQKLLDMGCPRQALSLPDDME